jgi:hypothetical protein
MPTLMPITADSVTNANRKRFCATRELIQLATSLHDGR